MTPSWRTLLAGLLAVGVLGCAQPPRGTPSPPPTPLPADRVVFQVTTAGGLVPHVFYLLESPRLIVWGDGRVWRQVEGSGGLVPVRFELAHTDAAGVAGLVARAEGSGLVSADTDFGHPGVTDQAATSVVVRGWTGESQVSVYALGFDRGLSAAQRRARRELQDLIDAASRLPGDAAWTAVVPQRVTVFEVAADSEPAANVPWPGPDPDSFLSRATGRAIGCGHLTGEEAVTAYAAALANPGARWLVDGTPRTLAVNPWPAAGDC